MRALALLFLILLLSGCASPGSGDPVRLVDIHGLAIDPQDTAALYIATHRGLLRLASDGELSSVGDSHDDLMGFAAHPKDPMIFWASGHPATGGNLGVIRSNDGGATWTPIGASGVDFHAMAVSPADPARIWGSWRGQMMRSDDGGAQWAPVGALAAAALAGHPSDRDIVYASTGKALQRSDDGGVTWTAQSADPVIGLAVDPNAPTTLYGGIKGGALRSTDGGRTWERTTLVAGTVAYFATHATAPGLVYAASYERGIYQSADSGATWTTILEPK